MKSTGASVSTGVGLKECGEGLANIRDYNKEVVIALEEVSKKMQGIDKDVCFVRQTVAGKLANAQSYLPKGMKLKVIDGFRPISAQKKIHKQYFGIIAKEHKNWTKAQVLEELDRWVTNPYTQIPPHSTGGSLDLTIVDSRNRELDMGTPVNTADAAKATTLSRAISSRARANRKLLIKVMSKAGFTNYTLEWWHWSYGEWRWALANHTTAIYGIYRGRMPRKK